MARARAALLALCFVAPSFPLHVERAAGNVRTSASDLSRRGVLAAAASCGALIATPATAADTDVCCDRRDAVPRGSLIERIFDTRSGSFVPARPERLLAPGSDRAAQLPRVVCCGEVHTAAAHHTAERRLVRALSDVAERERRERGTERLPLAIGLEMCYRQQQHVLDRFVFGDETETLAALRARLDWENTWGYAWEKYEPIFALAKARGVRLVGLNAPQPLVELVAASGLAGLDERLVPFVPKRLDLGVASHRARFEERMAAAGAAHGAALEGARLDRYYEAEVFWEEYMAETAARFVDANPRHRLLVLAGASHVEGRDGIPDRIAKRLATPDAAGAARADERAPFVVLPESVEWSPDGLPDVEQPLGRDTADWIWYTQRPAAAAA